MTAKVKIGCYTNPFAMDTSPEWYCDKCEEYHFIKNRRALLPFARSCGYKWLKTDNNGDCFYSSISLAMDRSVSVFDLRLMVSESFNVDQLEFYLLQSQMGGDEYDWAVNLFETGRLANLETIRDFILVEGRLNKGECVWADQFAINTIGLLLNINILFVDMDRSKNESPYRWLYKSSEEAEYIVLKRQNNHYQPLQDRYGGCRWYKSNLPSVVDALWSCS